MAKKVETDVTGLFGRSGHAIGNPPNRVTTHAKALAAIVGAVRRRVNSNPIKPYVRTRHYTPWRGLVPRLEMVLVKACTSYSPVSGEPTGTYMAAAIPNTSGFRGKPSFHKPYQVVRVDGPLSSTAVNSHFKRELAWLGVDLDDPKQVEWVE